MARLRIGQWPWAVIFACLALGVSQSGCKLFSSESESSTDASEEDWFDDDDEPPLAFEDAEIQGVWRTDCIGDSGLSLQEAMTISGNEITNRIEFFDDPNCDEVVIALETGSTFTLGGNARGGYDLDTREETWVENARELDLVLKTFEYVYYTQEYVDEANAEGDCGGTDWQVGVPQDLAGQLCAGQRLPSAGEKAYTIIGYTSGNVYMGNPNHTVSHNGGPSRPAELVTELPYRGE